VLLEADMSRYKRKKVIDKLAAVFILEGYLEMQRAKKQLVE
jgi:putative Holliday junction resolvase